MSQQVRSRGCTGETDIIPWKEFYVIRDLLQKPDVERSSSSIGEGQSECERRWRRWRYADILCGAGLEENCNDPENMLKLLERRIVKAAVEKRSSNQVVTYKASGVQHEGILCLISHWNKITNGGYSRTIKVLFRTIVSRKRDEKL